ncbi:MAG: hypothetical protein V3R81_02575, partial [Gammaproteobacteria bacterium]
MKKLLSVLTALCLFVGLTTSTQAQNSPTCGFSRIYLPAMSKAQEVKRIDNSENAITFQATSIDRAPDDKAPPIPTGFSVEDAIGGVVLHVAQETDTAHLADDFKEYVSFRAIRIDGATSWPIGLLELDRFRGSRHFVSIPVGQHWLFAVKARDRSGNPSGFSEWRLGISLRDSGMFDRFDGYGGSLQVTSDDELNWLQILNLDGSEPIASSVGTASFEPDFVADQDKSLMLFDSGGATPTEAVFTKVIDLTAEGRFGDDDFIIVTRYVEDDSSGGSVDIHFREDASNYFSHAMGAIGSGWQFAGAAKVDDFTTTGSPDWANITDVRIVANAATSNPLRVHFSDVRIVKASTAAGVDFSDTGDVWTQLADDNLALTNNPPGEWHIYTDMPGHPFALGQIDTVTSAERYLATREDRPQASATHACAMQLRYNNGQAGMIFRVRRPPVVAETDVLNAMFTNSSAAAVGQIPSAVPSGVSFGADATFGTYGVFGSSDTLRY